ncbi:MAG: NRDE family protein [Gammaproteobacteria bacterium]|nr:MAG: NRDE family protein [Gammaproteobacteria bacterium]
MCLLVLAWQAAPRYRLVVAANRDEYHERAAAALAKWPPPAALIAGRDLRAQGAWLAVDRERRFGVVTNFRELQPPRPGAPSRGELIPRYLNAPALAVSAQQFFAALEGDLNDRTQAADDGALPRSGSGLPQDWDRILSAPFVLHPQYGTRCSSVVLLEPGGRLYFAERRFDPRGEPAGVTEFELNPGEWP